MLTTQGHRKLLGKTFVFLGDLCVESLLNTCLTQYLTRLQLQLTGMPAQSIRGKCRAVFVEPDACVQRELVRLFSLPDQLARR